MVIVIDEGRLRLENWLDRWLAAGMPARPKPSPYRWGAAREAAAEARYDAMCEQRTYDRDSLDVPLEWETAA